MLDPDYNGQAACVEKVPSSICFLRAFGLHSSSVRALGDVVRHFRFNDCQTNKVNSHMLNRGFSSRVQVWATQALFVTLLFTMGFATSKAVGQDPDEFRFARIIRDNMVLQQGKPIRIWGWAEPGKSVSVTITQDEETGDKAILSAIASGTRNESSSKTSDEYSVTVQYVEANAPELRSSSVEVSPNDDGLWMATFQTAEASFRPTWIVAISDGKTIAVQNVLIGEIWVCAGQSNMGWSNFNRKGREAASADFPGLRYVAWHDSWYQPRADIRSNIQWQECSPETAQRFSAVPYLYGMFLHRYLKVPIGVINVARGGTTGQTWCLREELDQLDHVTVQSSLDQYDSDTAIWERPTEVARIMQEWEAAKEKARAEHAAKVETAKAEGKKTPRLRLPKQPADPRSGHSPPAGLFNATVWPIRHLSVRGVLYYQGENNNFMRWTRYEHTFPKVPISFRRAFGDEQLPFGCISQPGWGTFGLDPEVATVAEGYAIVRDIQRRAHSDDPNADMIATYPTGNSYIHPAEKLPVAEYASLWALAKVYGEPVVHRANEYQSMKVKDGSVFLYFDTDPVVHERWKHIENNAYWQVVPCPREGNAEFQGFIIAGADRRWYPAKAKHTRLDGTWTIEVWSDLVDDPVAVRYGWANWPTGNMVGRERLPLETFRTDNWSLPEGVSYSEDAKKAASELLKQLKDQGQEQALDRRLRQMQIDQSKAEAELHKGDAAGLIDSKVSRLKSVLDELLDPDATGRMIRRDQPELLKELEALRKQVEELHPGR